VLRVELVVHDVLDGEKLFQKGCFGEVRAVNLIGMLGLQAKEAGRAVRVPDTKWAVAVVVVVEVCRLPAVVELMLDMDGNGAVRLFQASGDLRPPTLLSRSVPTGVRVLAPFRPSVA
jgi:hypothetical protein